MLNVWVFWASIQIYRTAKGLMMLIQINSKTVIYRGFTIVKLPRKKPYSRQRYQVTKDSNYLGLDFALAEAIATIDQLQREVA